MRMFFSLAEIRDCAQFINCTTQAYYSLKFSPFFSFFLLAFVVCFTFFFNDGVICFVAEFQEPITFKMDYLFVKNKHG